MKSTYKNKAVQSGCKLSQNKAKKKVKKNDHLCVECGYEKLTLGSGGIKFICPRCGKVNK